MSFQFEWDDNKSDRNFQKHGVTFEEAQTIFLDPNSQTYDDRLHSLEEPRYIDIRMSARGRLLVVIYTESNRKICIISSRLSTTQEAKRYATDR